MKNDPFLPEKSIFALLNPTSVGLGKSYVLPFAGLKPGTHRFEFEADAKFFKETGTAGIDNGRILIHLSLLKQSTMMVLDFEIEGSYEVECDRCTVKAMIPVKGKQQLVVKLGEEDRVNDDESITLPYSEAEIDLSPFISEYITLSLPVRKVPCEVTGDTGICDRDVLEKVDAMKAKEDGMKGDMWEKLKNIKLT